MEVPAENKTSCIILIHAITFINCTSIGGDKDLDRVTTLPSQYIFITI